jgi:hypothetical protein
MNASTGQQFELEVYDILKRTLEVSMLGLVPAHTQIFHQKRYYSDLRKSFIKVDVSLEVTLPGADAPFFVWVWECKDYSHKVPVDDVEEFDSKLQQIGADNTKGTIITRSGFQRSVIEYAKSRKIGLARLTSSHELIHILYFGGQLLSDEARTIALMTNDLDAANKSHVRPFGGLDLQGNYVSKTNVFDYISRQLFVSLPQETGRACCCCGNTPVHTFMDVNYTAHTPRDSIKVWSSHALCQTCSRLLRYTANNPSNIVDRVISPVLLMAIMSGLASCSRNSLVPITVTMIIVTVLLILYTASQLLLSHMIVRRMGRFLGLSRVMSFRENVCISLLASLKGKNPDFSYSFEEVEFRFVENPPAF